MKKTYAILNLFTVIFVIFWNYYTNVYGINGNTVGSLSAEYQNLFTPASYAFSIWGLIFIALIAHGIFQIKRVFFDKKDDEFVSKIGPWLILANLANAGWVWSWLSEQTGLSVFLMLIILISLSVIIVRLNMKRWEAPRPIIAWVWWPISLYSGWIAVATIANISAYLAKNEWSFLFSEITWTVIMIAAAVVVNLAMVYLRNMREFTAVGVWALVAIAVKHWGNVPILQWTAFIGTAVLLVAISAHLYQNRRVYEKQHIHVMIKRQLIGQHLANFHSYALL